MKISHSNALRLFTIAAVTAGSLAQAQVFYPQTDGSQRTYDDVQKYIKDVASANPTTTELVEVGESDSGKIIQGLKIGHGSVAHMVVSTHHGNEYGATEVALAFAKDLAVKPIENKVVYVIPVLNIEGYNHKNRYEPNTSGSHDPNRDYPGPCATEGPFALKSTKTLDSFVAANGIVAAATLHTYWPVVAYPWGNSTDNPHSYYDDIFIALANSATSVSHYQTGFSGEAIYPADGTFEDYAFWKYGIWTLLFEMGGTHTPDQAQVDELNRVNVPGLRKMMEDAQLARAEKHEFTAQCSTNKGWDPHIE